MGVPDTFKTQTAVLGWLQAAGYKIGKTSLSDHVRAGHLRPNKSGMFTLSAVKQFAKSIKRKETGQREQDDHSDLHAKKLQAENEKLEEQVKLLRIEREAKEGKLIPREDIYRELAGRALALESGLKGRAESRLMEIIELVEGNPAKASELREMLLSDIDAELGEYARDLEWEVEL